MNKIYERVRACYESIANKLPFRPKVALILGSGLGSLADEVEVKATIPYNTIANFPVSTVPGHKGRFVFAYIGEVPVVIMQGRVHYYEGYSMEEVVLPTRLMHEMGAETLFVTNAAGGANPNFKAGDLMLIADQIMNFVPSPLIGPNAAELGERFPDMSEIYTKKLQQLLLDVAKKLEIKLQTGVYVQTTGPNFESPAEVRMLQRLGGDAIGMSTACEAVTACHMGMQVCGISCISNLAAGLSVSKLSDDDVKKTANLVGHIFKRLVTEAIKEMAHN